MNTGFAEDFLTWVFFDSSSKCERQKDVNRLRKRKWSNSLVGHLGRDESF